MKALANPRYSPVIRCGYCFLISFIGFYVPPMLTDAPGGMVIWILTGPFVLGACVVAIVSCGTLLINNAKDKDTPPSLTMIMLAILLTIGTLSPILLFIIGHLLQH